MAGPQTHIPADHDRYPCGCIAWDVGDQSLYLKPCGPALCLAQQALKNLLEKPGVKHPKNRVILHNAPSGNEGGEAR